MKQTIRLNESDIRRMVHEAVNRLIRESADSKDMINLKGERLMSTLKTVPNAVIAWAEAVKSAEKAVQQAENNDAYDVFNAGDNSSAGEDMNNGSMEDDDDGIDDSITDDEETADNSTNDVQDNSDVDKYYLPEYVALWALAVQSISDYNKRGFFNSSDITKMKNGVLYQLTMEQDYVTKRQSATMSDDELNKNYIFKQSKGHVQYITPEEYGKLPQSERKYWRICKKGEAKGLYLKHRPKVDGQGNQFQPLISDKQIVNELSDIVHFAFSNGYILKFAPKITHDAHPYESFKYTIRQAGVHYLQTVKKDTFLHTVNSDVSGDNNGDSDETSYKVPEELRDYQVNRKYSAEARAKKSLDNLRCFFEWLAYKNNGRVQFDVGGSLNQKFIKYLSIVITEHFDEIFDEDTLGDMIDYESGLSLKSKTTQKQNKGQTIQSTLENRLTEYCSNISLTIPGKNGKDRTLSKIGQDKCKEFMTAIFNNKINMERLKQYKKEIFGTEDIYESRIRRIIRETIRRRLF